MFVGVLLVFLPALRCGFVNYDDPDYVTANPHITGGLTGEAVRWAFGTADVSYWHPLTWLSHQVDWTLFGANPVGHHATSIVLHAANAALVFLVLHRLTRRTLASAVVAALFAFHPLRVESVAWVAERKDVLSGFFWLASIGAYVGYAGRRAAGDRAWGWYLAVAGLFVAGLMSKPMVVTLPLVLLVLDVWPLARWRPGARGRLVVEKVPLAALAVIVSWVTIRAQAQVGTLSEALPFSARLANAVVAVARYVGKAVFPFDLSVLYPHPGHWPLAAVVAASGFGLAFSWCAWSQRTRRPWWWAGWLWFLITLLPVCGIVQVGIQSMADRYTYVPALGLAVAVVWQGAEWCGSRCALRTAGLPVAVLLGALVMLTVAQLRVWRSSLTLFHHAIAVAGEGNYLAYNNRGVAYYRDGKLDRARADYEQSLAINPDYPDANNNLGQVLEEQGAPLQAIAYFRRALARKPNAAEIHLNLANALADAGDVPAALAAYDRALALRPNDPETLNSLGATLAMAGRVAEGEARIEAALRVSPHNASAHSNLGNVLAMQGRRAEAVEHYRQALAIRNDDARTLYNLGATLSELGATAEAIGDLQRAVALSPFNPDAHARLGLALAQAGRRDDGRRELLIALQQNPNHAQARAWLAAVDGAAASR